MLLDFARVVAAHSLTRHFLHALSSSSSWKWCFEMCPQKLVVFLLKYLTAELDTEDGEKAGLGRLGLAMRGPHMLSNQADVSEVVSQIVPLHPYC